MLTLIAKITAKAGKEEEAKAELIKIVAPTLAEEGCIEYTLHQSAEDPKLFFFYENWESKEHLAKHSVSAHITAFGEKAGELLEGPAELYPMLKV
ncbi:Quinol monooxygenase YgiN [Pseudarcicella hirudinis]|uniref:Quinol monooxygenase YgiN n=1 Tax=Pseudarcicella hirudinis TaxID=1079859 RepID=A0A1I5QNL7_9BACT|nr:putative quinol monooxygenase [Pseudarcicella hirudinis]SFP47687.1 Quinol monooxygenase YgiN [Pseudarcicella hirudinis]